jgi:hypothetical protein
MSVETRKSLREKIAQSRRLLQQSFDPKTVENPKAFIEDLEGRLLIEMGDPPTE